MATKKTVVSKKVKAADRVVRKKVVAKIVEKKLLKLKKVSVGLVDRKPARLRAKIASLNSSQQKVSGTKFYTGVGLKTETVPQFSTELPQKYYEDKIVVQVRDPWWLHSYWEVQDSTVNDIRRRFGNDFHGARLVLRVYDISYIIFNGTNAHRFFDIDVNLESGSWYVDIAEPGRSWCIDIGFLLKNGTFIMIARSNVVTTPLDGPSWVMDEEWMIPDEMFARLYGLGFGFGPNSPTGKGWLERLKLPMGSPGLFSISSPRRFKTEGKKPFWLVVNTELIVYGATEPDARVTVCGKDLKLNPDGTFSLRFALPDGKQTIPVEAWSNDGTDHRCITPIVSKETR
ncbi:MAG: DUF4912 domain-containing protein [Candidatus Omnitrophota bacterium]